MQIKFRKYKYHLYKYHHIKLLLNGKFKPYKFAIIPEHLEFVNEIGDYVVKTYEPVHIVNNKGDYEYLDSLFSKSYGTLIEAKMAILEYLDKELEKIHVSNRTF